MTEKDFVEKYPSFHDLIVKENKGQYPTAKFKVARFESTDHNGNVWVDAWYLVGDQLLWINGIGSPDDNVFLDEYYIIGPADKISIPIED